MITTPKLIFQCNVPLYRGPNDLAPVCGPQQFETTDDLCSFIRTIDWTAPRLITRAPMPIVEFQLGAQFQFQIQDYLFHSDIHWGPRFMLGTAVRNGKILAPMDTHYNPAINKICRDFVWQDINPRAYDAVISPRLAQVWPHIYAQRSVLQRFVDLINSQQIGIQNLLIHAPKTK